MYAPCSELLVTVGDEITPVSYTHLDVYKRQVPFRLKGTSYSGDEVDITVKTNKEGVAEFLEIPIGNFLLYENDVPAFFVTPDPEEVKVIYAQTNEEKIQNRCV